MGEALQDPGTAGRAGGGWGGALAALREEGFARLEPSAVAVMLDVEPDRLDALRPSWDRLPADGYLRDGGRYRRRRHGSCIVELPEGRIERPSRRAHWQPVDYNALHGGFERWFEPIEATVERDPAWTAVIVGFGRLFAELRPVSRWHVEAHQFRIDTTGGIGRPTPEGAHRDGVDFVAILMVGRENIRGGESRVFEAHGPRGLRFTVTQPWSALLIDDARVIHETTPIQPAQDAPGWRDTLVVTYRADGFLSPDSPPAPGDARS